MARVCIHHSFLLSESLCGRCGAEFCRECLVFPRGQKLPLCTTCALTAGGANVSGPQPLPKREIRKRARERQAEMATAVRADIPEIANPVPAGWAFGELEELPNATPAATGNGGRNGGRRRNRDAPRNPKSRADKSPEPEPADDMMAWLESVYTSR